MNKEIKLLDLTNYIIHFKDGTCMFIDRYISEAQDEIFSLKNNWNKLKKLLNKYNNGEYFKVADMLKYMQKLEDRK